MTVTLQFHGAAGTVTGSCYRIIHPKGQFLIDCGLFQGNKTVRALNDKPLPFDPAKIDYLLLTHAHIDHAGLLPKLYKHGFRSTMTMTEPTAGLLEYLLPDSAGIQESDADRENRHRGQRGDAPVEPLYRIVDAEEALKHRVTVDYHNWIEPGPGVRARYWNAGHILGSASIEVEVAESDGSIIHLMFSGDIGPDEKVFYRHPEGPSGFDYILSESTYGGRERADYTLEQRREALRTEINSALGRGGNLVIPAFAVERSQELLHDIGWLIKEKEINPSLVFLDSPLASKVTAVYKKYAKMFEDVELSADELFNDPRFRIIEAVEDSKAINNIKGGAIIILPELLDVRKNIVPASTVQARRVVTQLVQDLVHLEGRHDGLDQYCGPDAALRHPQRVLGVHEHVVPEPRLQVRLQLGQVKVRPAAP